MDDDKSDDDRKIRWVWLRPLTWADFKHNIRLMVDNDPSVLVEICGGLAVIGGVIIWGEFFA
ncbi:hypothetical protein SAMN06265174_103203 [Dietzia kunjamensis subsp. schimae]|uniref:Uncharacterized protein n=1 Tax=Dietzia kunjamensis subsp. schimae TaxID=498198 RepID=A0ABY1N0G8_9ACTN|nr:hypothetical protein [Dietzia kunjamensis]MBB1016403.1 hypothetical protein [Dietzia kunjamensis subsp. schimae]SMO66215.1 hypothetical protein SAMN06265174_103203 [Dietzia kunjamensis subsp. schimae]